MYDLSTSYEVNGMDGNTLSMTRILVMMAPGSLSAEGSEILSAISSAIIESSESMAGFQEEGEQELYQRLNRIFFTWMKEKTYHNSTWHTSKIGVCFYVNGVQDKKMRDYFIIQ